VADHQGRTETVRRVDNAATRGSDPSVVIAALLHDAVEDQEARQLRRGCGVLQRSDSPSLHRTCQRIIFCAMGGAKSVDFGTFFRGSQQPENHSDHRHQRQGDAQATYVAGDKFTVADAYP
jgi:hypothetical protein